MSDKVFKDLVIVELASVLAGPSVGQFFAELGAKVIKVENLHSGGDVTRTWKSGKEDPETSVSGYFSSVNWGKYSIALDLKKAGGKKIIYDLVKKADIVLASYKPGDAEKLQMDYESLSNINPSISYGRITAYGSQDSRPGFDAILQAETGFTYMNGTPDSGPVKMPVALIDVLAAHQLKEALLIALLERFQSGKGSLKEVSLFHSGIASLVNQATNYLVGGMIPQPIGSEHPNIVPYGTSFESADGKLLVIAVGSNRQFQGLCEVLGISEMSEDHRFKSNYERVNHREELIAILKKEFIKKPRQDWIQALNEVKVPAGEVRNMEEVFADPLTQKIMFQDEKSGIQGVSEIAFQDSPELMAPPSFNQGGKYILEEWLSYSESHIQMLEEQGIILS